MSAVTLNPERMEMLRAAYILLPTASGRFRKDRIPIRARRRIRRISILRQRLPVCRRLLDHVANRNARGLDEARTCAFRAWGRWVRERFRCPPRVWRDSETLPGRTIERAVCVRSGKIRGREIASQRFEPSERKPERS